MKNLGINGAIGGALGYLVVGGVGGVAMGVTGAVTGYLLAGKQEKSTHIPLLEIYKRAVNGIKDQGATLIREGLIIAGYWSLSRNTRIHCNSSPNDDYCGAIRNFDVVVLTYVTARASYLFHIIKAKIYSGPSNFEKVVDTSKELGSTLSKLAENSSLAKRQITEVVGASKDASYDASNSSW